jgi:hypothetical protein
VGKGASGATYLFLLLVAWIFIVGGIALYIAPLFWISSSNISSSNFDTSFHIALMGLPLLGIGAIIYVIPWIGTMIHQGRQPLTITSHLVWLIGTLGLGLFAGPIGGSACVVIYWFSLRQKTSVPSLYP